MTLLQILGDILESLLGAVFVDSDQDLETYIPDYRRSPFPPLGHGTRHHNPRDATRTTRTTP
jgi:dsRNA-specific ribonuclease